MKKRMIAILLTLCMMTTLLPAEALAVKNRTGQNTLSASISAYVDEAENDEGNPAKSDASSGPEDEPIGANDSVATQSSNTDIAYPVTGGNIYFDAATGTITNCDYGVTDAKIPDTINGIKVTSIGDSAFWDCSNLKKIIIPSSITDFGANSLHGCNSLTSAGPIGGGYDYEFGWIDQIPAFAFGSCSGLTSISLPDSITIIGAGTFSGCSSLTNMTIPYGVTEIGNSAFRGCTSLVQIAIPDSVISIGTWAFMECSSLKSVTLPNNITGINDRMFSGCSSLTSINIPESVTNIWNGVFQDCTSLKSIVIPDSVTIIGSFLFSGCSNLTRINMPSHVTEIGYHMFDGCRSLISITIPDNVTTIGAGAFIGCASLTKIIIPKSITKIFAATFAECSSLTSIIIPDSVTTIGEDAFFGCSNLTDVYFGSNKDVWNAMVIDRNNENLISATIHYNSTGPGNVDPPEDTASSVHFFSGWNPTTRNVSFDEQSSPYYLAASIDAASVDALVGKYVLATVTTDSNSVLEVVNLQPVESKIGVVTDVIIGNGSQPVKSLQFDDITYAVVGSPYISDDLIGKTVLYHLHTEEIVKFEVLEKKTGMLEAWDGTTRQATIDGVVYPTNYMSDLSFRGDIDKYLGNKIVFSTSGNNSYMPLICIDEMIEAESEIAVFSTEKSLTVQTGESLWLGFGKIVDGQIVGDWKRMAIVVSDPTVISLSEYEETEYGYSLEVTGKKQGATNITITDTESGLSTVIVLTVRDSYVGTYSYAIDSMETFYPSNKWENQIQTNIYNLNGLYVNNYVCSKVDNTYTVSFDVYNSKYHTGAVDIYDADGNWISCEEIKKYSLISSLWDAREQDFYLISDLVSGKLLTYEQASFSKKSHVSFEVPDKGYFTISNNFAESPGTFLFNSCDILYDGLCTLIDAGLDKVEPSAFSGLIKEKVTEDKTVREVFIGIFKKTVEKEVRAYAKRIINGEIDGVYSDISGQLENVLSSLDISWKHLFKTAFGVGESAFTKLAGPAGIALKGCFAFAKGSNQLMQAIHLATSVDVPYVTVFSSIDEGAINSHGVIVNTNGNVDAEAELHVFRVSNNDTIEVVLDGDKDGHLKKYELYNICFVKNDQLVQPNGKVIVHIPIPDGMKKDTCNVYRQESNGTWTLLTAHIEDNYLVFETDHFSLYGVVGDLYELEISSLPNKTLYSAGDILNPDGLVLSLGEDLIAEGFICEPMVLSQAGTQKITVRYGIASTEFTVLIQVAVPPAQTYTLTVTNGTGSGDYESGVEVAIVADTAEEGKMFDQWITNNGGTFADASSTSTTFTMPACDITVTATYKDIATPPVPTTYTINFDANGGITSTASMITGTDGKLASLPTASRSGYLFNGWFSQPVDGEEISIDTVFTKDTTVYAQWVQNIVIVPTVPTTPPSTPGGSGGNDQNPPADNNKPADDESQPNENQPTSPAGPDWVNPFSDVVTGAWYYDAVKFVSENGLMNGLSSTVFAPKTNLTRAQLTQILYNKEGKPFVNGASVFTDVTADSWYAPAIAWAVAKNIVGGYGNGLFGPNDNITREQLAVMLWRYAGEPTANSDLAFSDANQISDFAQAAICWGVENKILNGKGNNILDPKGFATRAEVAQMLKNYLDN